MYWSGKRYVGKNACGSENWPASIATEASIE